MPTAVKLTVEDYLLLDGAGAFDSYPKTELIDGTVYAVSPQHRPHGFVKDELAYRLRRALEALRSVLHVATEQSVAIGLHSEPQPDIILTTEPRGTGAIPLASVALLVEVADTTVRFDLDEKARLYAAGGIAEYWVAEVEARIVHRMWHPSGDSYAEYSRIAFGEPLAAATIDELIIETSAL